MEKATKKLRPEDVERLRSSASPDGSASAMGLMETAIAENLHGEVHETLVPAARRRMSAEQHALTILEALVSGSGRRLRVAGPLGSGGMGVVRAASQVALDRTVAVKSLHPSDTSNDAKLTLLREAWITGSLEHPNIVPVYDLEVDDSGDPMLVLKRIEGVTWNTLMHDPEAIARRFSTDDALAWNLEIFLSVCNAIRFAHSRGILHRDLKPENVMIGEFGEVYVLDWGIAVSLIEDDRGVLPLAQDALEAAGTPCYMAPEMLGAGADPLSERTDVYLLGGLLYKIMTGEPPHTGDTALHVLQSVVISEPTLPDEAPARLAEICLRAMNARPDDRVASAAAMHAEVSEFMRYRGSARLADKAERDLAELTALIARTDDQTASESRRQELYRLFGACQFGFRQALETWPDNRAARSGMAQAVEAMAAFELQAGHARAAAALMAELPEPPPALRKRVEAALEALDLQEQRMRELEKLSADLDITKGAGQRRIALICSGLILLIVPVAVQLWMGAQALAYPLVSGITAGFMGLALLAYLSVRHSTAETGINRRAAGALLILIAAQGLCEFGFHQLGYPARDAVLFLLLLSAVVSAMMINFTGVAIWPIVGAFAGAFALSAWRIEWVLYAMSMANLVVIGNLVLLGLQARAAPTEAAVDAPTEAPAEALIGQSDTDYSDIPSSMP